MNSFRGVTSGWIVILAVSLGIGCAREVIVNKASSQVDLNADFAKKCATFNPQVQRPGNLCGLEGYTYLHSVYIKESCGGCHFIGSTIHPNALADPDVSLAYLYAKAWNPQTLLDTVIASQFVNQECYLPEWLPFREDVEYWIAHQNCN